MKTFIVVLSAAAVLGIGAMAYAHGTGAGGWGGGYMMGPGYGGYMMGAGYGGHMMGPGYGGAMMGWRGPGYGTDTKFMDETAGLRKELHDKKFEYFEASRNPETDPGRLTKLENELAELQTKIREKAPRGNYGGYAGYGRCW
jgi:hypothetical protein